MPGDSRSCGELRRRSSKSRRPSPLLAALVNVAACTSMHAHAQPAAEPRDVPTVRDPASGGRSWRVAALQAIDINDPAFPAGRADDDTLDDEPFEPVEPYDLEAGEVIGPVAAEYQAAFEAEYDDEEEEAGGDVAEAGVVISSTGSSGRGPGAGARTLSMKGKRRKAYRYAKCARCTVTSCKRSTGKCTGYCRRGRRLFRCVGRPEQKTCIRPSIGQTEWFTRPETLPADRLPPLSSVVVSANVPYIGCANITGLPTGCPAASTPGGSARRFTLLGSTCVQSSYRLADCESPYYPFGYCMCQYEFKLSRGRTRVRDIPCSSIGMGLDLDLATAPAEDGGADPLLSDLRVTLERDGATTLTSFQDYGEETDGPLFSYNLTFPLNRRPAVNVRLDYFFTYYSKGNNFTTAGVVLPEYDDDPDALAYEELVEDYYFRSRYWDGSYEECIDRCELEGADILGNVDEDYYTVVYDASFRCPHCFPGDDGPEVRPGSVTVIPL